MNKEIFIEKATGEKQIFDRQKLYNSLNRAGASEVVIEKVISEILDNLYNGISTREIYKDAFRLLKKYKSSNAARYSLKKAIMELGPTGYPFEVFVSHILAKLGFSVEVGKIVQGKCITHEVDVIASANNTQYLVECKYYNSLGKYANVQVPLYIRSRVDDIVAYRKNLPEFKDTNFFGWVVTNTRFTDDALKYGLCAGLNLLGWDIPKNKGLKDLIEKSDLFPITVLTNLNKKDKSFLLNKEVILCKQLIDSPETLDELNVSTAKKKQILGELKDLMNY
ncbi:MAG: restriction endonuclease [Bacteroidetes bacterium]|nr:restriction endonuclease [Bacteroidota bacterium]